MVSHLTFLALEALLPAVVLVVVTGLLLRFAWKERRGQRVLLLEVFVLFLFGVLTVTGVPSIRYLTPDFTINLIPFSEVPQGLPGSLLQPVLNVVLFVPLGILLPLLWDKYRVCWRTVLFGGGLSLCIELMQLFNFRTTDLDDLLWQHPGGVGRLRPLPPVLPAKASHTYGKQQTRPGASLPPCPAAELLPLPLADLRLNSPGRQIFQKPFHCLGCPRTGGQTQEKTTRCTVLLTVWPN